MALQHTQPDPVAHLVLYMGRALHRYGCPAHRTEEVMRLLAQHLGTEGNFYATPTAILASFGSPEVPRTHLIRVGPADVDLEAQVDLDDVIEDILADRCSPAEGLHRINAIEYRPRRYRFSAVVAAAALVSAAAAVLFQGHWWDVAVAGAIGVVIGALRPLTRYSIAFGRVFEGAGAFVAFLIASGAAILWRQTSVFIDVLAGVLLLLPGLTLTVALQELATKNLSAGTARLMGAFVTLAQLGFGAAIASQLLVQFVDTPYLSVPPLPAWTQLSAAFAGAVGFTVLLSVHPRDLLWILVAAAVAIFASRWGSQYLGPEMGAFIGALAVGIGSNVRARVLNKTAAVTLIPGVLLLVPGSIGFRSMSAFLSRDVVTALDTTVSMFFIGLSLVAGVLLANLLVEPRRAL